MAIDKNEYSFFVYSWVVFLKKCVGGGGGGGAPPKRSKTYPIISTCKPQIPWLEKWECQVAGLWGMRSFQWVGAVVGDNSLECKVA